MEFLNAHGLGYIIYMNSEKSEADQGAVEGEGKDSQLKGAPGSKHLRLLPADDKLTGGGSPVASDEAES